MSRKALGTMTNWTKVFAGAVAAAAVVLLAYAVLTPEPQTTDTDHMGMWNGSMTYSSTNVGLIAASVIIIVASLMVMVLWHAYEPLPPSMAPPLPVRAHLAAEPVQATSSQATEVGAKALAAPNQGLAAPPQNAPVATAAGPEDEASAAAAHNYLVLRLLTGDERLMFKTLMDSKGEALQKDLILTTKMSNAKVSRVLDRLHEKGLVTKERHGATNKVRIKLQG